MGNVYVISKITEGEPTEATVYTSHSKAVSAMERELLYAYEDIIMDLDDYDDIGELKDDLKDIYVGRRANGDIACISYGLIRIELIVANFFDME